MRKRDSIRPPDAPMLGTTYRDWRDFTERVARPWLDNDGKDPKIDNWYHTLMIEADPWYLACALVIADNTIRRLEGDGPTPDNTDCPCSVCNGSGVVADWEGSAMDCARCDGTGRVNTDCLGST